MSYKTMKASFHEGKRNPEEELIYRKSLPETVVLDFALREDVLFFTMFSEVYEQLLLAAKLDKEISKLCRALPGRAIGSYMEACLVEEIVLTNKIEGVHSTRKEITEVLERLKENDRRGRFNGLVQKYVMLSSGQRIALETCEDVRDLYDELVLDEVAKTDPKNAPDGKIFRSQHVQVCNAGGEVVHSGILPESAIIELVKESLKLLSNGSIEQLCKAALFHYAFGYIHPFYDGNGRMNRFISSYLLNKEYEPLVGLRLSYAIKENLKEYYKAFEICEHPLNRGDLTPFVISFAKISVAAMTDIRDSLRERQEKLDFFNNKISLLEEDIPAASLDIAYALVTATLFSTYGLDTSAISEAFEISRQTVYKRIAPLRSMGILRMEKVGRKTYYSLDLDKLAEPYPSSK